MPLKCIPLRPEWTGSTAPDLRAIYRRRKQDNYGTPILDADGREQWDTTGALPLRQHDKWAAKGFEYITLADEQSLGRVAGALRADGLDPQSFIQDRRARSPFSAEMWHADQRAAEDARLVQLRELVAKHGVEAVEAMRGPIPASIKDAAKPKPTLGQANQAKGAAA